MRILLVEDDESLADLIEKALSDRHRYIVDSAKDGYFGLILAESFEYDLILLDLLLPKVSGIDFCQQLRSKGDLTPILLLTAQDTVNNKVAGLDAGADDYLVKPFDLQELLARIRALLRRGHDALQPKLEWENLTLDPNSCQVTYGEKLLKLTAKEYSLLELFLRHPQRIFSQNILIDRIWSYEEAPSPSAVRTQIKGLRKKLTEAGVTKDLIETVYGLGYRLKKKISNSEKDATLVVSSEEFGTKNLYETKNTAKNKHQFDSQLSMTSNLQAIWRKHQEKYLDRVQFISGVIKNAENSSLNPNLVSEAIIEAHTLSGSLGVFGFEQASHRSREVEKLLKSWSDIDREDRLYLSQLVGLLEQDLKQDLSFISPLTLPSSLSSNQTTIEQDENLFLTAEGGQPQAPACQAGERVTSSSTPEERHLLIIDDDLPLVEALVSEAKAWNIRTEIAQNPDRAGQIMHHSSPDAILLDLSFPNSQENGFEFLQRLSETQPELPVIVFTAQENFSNRVKVARLGAKSFLQKPISSHEVLEAIVQVLQDKNTVMAKLMVVDDDPGILDTIQTLLEPRGWKLTLLSDPRQFWDTLEHSNPDLLILDIEMPEFSGVDLTKVVRNDPRWCELPIISLSAHQDTETIQKMFTIGVDDYLQKPIVAEQLIARIESKLERERYRRRIADTDSLTGTTIRRKSIQQFNRILNLAKRQQQSFCFMILDLDRFKQINDLHGHDCGDRVLRSLGKSLSSTFRGEDIIARWGGEEFVIGSYNMTKSFATKRLEKFLSTFSQEEFIDNSQQKFKVTFSAGVAQYPIDGNDLQTLYQKADAVLYQAKLDGRNRIYSWE